MKPVRIITAFCSLGLLATASIAAAANYTITWKNQFASNTTCTLKTTVVTPTGTIPDSTNHAFTSLGQTKPITISSPTCSRITVSAACTYTDAQGHTQKNDFSRQPASCRNSTATLNSGIMGSITVTDTSNTPQGIW